MSQPCRWNDVGGRTFRDGGNERAIMRYTLTVGLLVCMPAVALLAVAGVAVLCGNVRHRLGQAVDHPRPERGTARASVSGLQFAPGPDQDRSYSASVSVLLLVTG